MMQQALDSDLTLKQPVKTGAQQPKSQCKAVLPTFYARKAQLLAWLVSLHRVCVRNVLILYIVVEI